MRFTTLIFDLDGTLLDTLADLHASVAHGLRTHGLAERSVAEVRAFLGNGIRNLIERSVPEGTDTPTSKPFLQIFVRTICFIHSTPRNPIPAFSNCSSDCAQPACEWALSATN